MIIFLYGPDTYRSQQKLNKIIEKYKKIHKSGLNFYIVDFKEKDFKDFKQNIGSFSMFKEKKLIVLKNLFSSDNTVNLFLDYLKNHKIFEGGEEIIIIYEKEIFFRDFKGQKKDLFEKLKKSARVQEFKLLGGYQLKNWLEKELFFKKAEISSNALEKLILFVGNDLWRMSNEINKLISFEGTPLEFNSGKENSKIKITEKSIDSLVRPKFETNIFKTIEAIASRNKKLALKLIQEHRREGESENYIFSMILWQIRNLIKVKSADLRSGKSNNLAKKLRLHPYVFEKTLKQTKKFTMEELKKIYQKLLRVDYKIKTGKIKPGVALDLFIAEIC